MIFGGAADRIKRTRLDFLQSPPHNLNLSQNGHVPLNKSDWIPPRNSENAVIPPVSSRSSGAYDNERQDQFSLTGNAMSESSSMRDRLFRPWITTPSFGGLKQEVGELVETFLGEAAPHLRGAVPRIDVIELPEVLEITADVPGWQNHEITVELTGDLLVISGKRAVESSSQPDQRRVHREERRFSNFTRSIPLPCPVDDSKVDATLKDGVLTIHLAKRADIPRRQVPIRGPETQVVTPS